MCLHDLPVCFVQFSGVMQDIIRDTDLAYIMEWCSDLYNHRFTFREADTQGDQTTIFCHPADMLAGLVRTGFDRFTEHV